MGEIKLKLYLLSQTVNHNYDTYDYCIVCAESMKEAKNIVPGGNWDYWAFNSKNVSAKLIGIANKNIAKGVVLASFNAG